MLNAGGNPGALREPRRITPTPPPLPVAPVGNAGNTGWNGAGGVQLQVVSGTSAKHSPTKQPFELRHLAHPDVVAPVIAALIVLAVLLAWAS